MRLDISRPVLMTHFAPRACSSPISCCNFTGMGGFSNSAKMVPSKSVEISLIGMCDVAHVSCYVFLNLENARGVIIRHAPRNAQYEAPACFTRSNGFTLAGEMSLQEQ